MTGGQVNGSEPMVDYDRGKSITLVDADSDAPPIEKVRTAVNVTKEAVHAISITALEKVSRQKLLLLFEEIPQRE